MKQELRDYWYAKLANTPIDSSALDALGDVSAEEEDMLDIELIELAEIFREVWSNSPDNKLESILKVINN
jgi:hypothetical protein